ncbi:hypothetical protein [Runella salmonicolor]|uniref:Class I SAM-dependent methyltransferase n=1 Tax=Runella salmonicolor TaxID=2950278 RepID=A0ABT1FHG6_9BACT|nr:hypothetical protein [Runella salmonicolor]MCP1381209.1 hypothetical protein [Runella salmonicolor]
MGIVRMGPPEDVIEFLKSSFNVNLFIETGTFYGGTTIWASKIFDRVKTIEYSNDIFNITKEKYKELQNVDFIFGDSRKELKDIVAALEAPALFWLDAHWCSFGSYGEKDQCPLLEELDIINSSEFEHFLLIDDARLFLSPPPLPNLLEYYPNIQQIIEKLNKKHHEIVIYEDVIIAVPFFAKKVFLEFMQEKTTKDQEEASRKYAIDQKKKKIKYVIKRILRLEF